MATYPDVQGRAHEHSSAEIQLNGRIFTAISAVDWDESLTPVKGRGTRPEPLYRTLGEYDCEASITMPLKEYAEFIAFLGDGYGGVSFNVVITYSDEGVDPTTVKFIGARVENPSGGSETGGDPVMIEIGLNVMRIEMNGLVMVPGMLK